MRNRVRVIGLCMALLLCAGNAGAGAPLVNADVAVDKSAPGTVMPGADIAYTIGILNGGPDAADAVVLNDPLPAGLTFVSLTQESGPAFACSDPGAGNGGTVSCTIATLAAGAGAQFTLVANVPPGTPAGTDFTNIATATAATFDPNDKNNSGTAVTFVPAPQADLLVQKIAADSAGPDTDLVYDISVGNVGPDAADGFTLDDTLPGDLTFVSLQQTSGPAMSCSTPASGAGGSIQCTLASFAAGATASFVLTTHVPSGTPSGTQYTNTAVVDSATPDANTVNDSSTVTTTISEADVSVSKTGPANAVAGGQVSYTLTVTNAGPDFAQAVTLSDALPTPLTFVSLTQNSGPAFNCTLPGVGNNGTVNCSGAQLNNGQSAQFTLVAQVPANAPDGSSVQNTAIVFTGSYDGNAANDSSSVVTTISNTADVFVGKTAPAMAVAGGNLPYSLQVGNNGPDVASNVTLSDTLPANTTFVSLTQSGPAMSCTTPAVGAAGTVTCTRVSLAPGASTSLTLTVQVSAAAPNASVIGNTATVTSGSTDTNAANDSATATTTVNNTADLTLTKTAPANAAAGGNLAYAITLANAGPAAAGNVSLSDTLPANTTFVSLAQGGTPLTCVTPAVGAAGTVTCTAASFANAASTTLTLTVLVSDTAPNATPIANTATVTTASVDPAPANNTATATSTVSNTADLGITKTAPATGLAGTTIAYTLVATNNGPLGDSATIVDTLPAGVNFISLSQTAGPAFACMTPPAGGSGTITCTLAAFPSGSTASFTINVQVAPASPTGTVLTNVAMIDGARTDPNQANDSATATTTVDNPPDLALTKTGPGSIEPDTSFAYTLDLTNFANGVAADVVLTDVLPAQTRFVSLVQNTGPAFICTTPAVGANGTVSCSIAVLPSGAVVRFTLTVSLAPGATGTVTNTASVNTSSADAAPANNASSSGAGIGFGPATAPITIPTLSWFGLMALVLAVGLFGAALVARQR